MTLEGDHLQSVIAIARRMSDPADQEMRRQVRPARRLRKKRNRSCPLWTNSQMWSTRSPEKLGNDGSVQPPWSRDTACNAIKLFPYIALPIAGRDELIGECEKRRRGRPTWLGRGTKKNYGNVP
jgi:hypothetical protein